MWRGGWGEVYAENYYYELLHDLSAVKHVLENMMLCFRNHECPLRIQLIPLLPSLGVWNRGVVVFLMSQQWTNTSVCVCWGGGGVLFLLLYKDIPSLTSLPFYVFCLPKICVCFLSGLPLLFCFFFFCIIWECWKQKDRKDREKVKGRKGRNRQKVDDGRFLLLCCCALNSVGYTGN